MREIQAPETSGKGQARALRTRDETTGELRPLTATEAAPLVACLRAPAAGYRELDVETYMILAWVCFTWQRTGEIPKGPPPRIVFAQEAADAPKGS